jgi:hypothetical protein
MRSSGVDRALHGHTPPEVVMLRFQAILAVAMLFATGCSAACAGDFVPRAASGGLAAVADDPGARSASTDVASAAAMSESDSIATTSSTDSSHSTSTPASARRAAHVGADDVAAETHTAAPSGDDHKSGGAPAGPHKSKSGLHWQSLLPGVMK